MDMNILYKPRVLEIIEHLGKQRVCGKVVRYELICGIDWRYLTDELATALHDNRFDNIRFAWDGGFNNQYKMKDTVGRLVKAGYESKKLSCFIICNWRIPFGENVRKLDLLKVWRVKANDCWYDNQRAPDIKPVFWSYPEIREFRHLCRKHNQVVLFGIDPETDVPFELSPLRDWGVE